MSPDKIVLSTAKAFRRKVASWSWRYLFSKANNIHDLKSDGHLTFLFSKTRLSVTPGHRTMQQGLSTVYT